MTHHKPVPDHNAHARKMVPADDALREKARRIFTGKLKIQSLGTAIPGGSVYQFENIEECLDDLLELFHTEAERIEVEARLDELEKADDRNTYNPGCQGCYNNVSGNADRIEELKATLSTKESEERL